MAAQDQENKQTEDPILEHLDEINDALDENEKTKKKTRARVKKQPQAAPDSNKKKIITYVLCALLGISLGLGTHALFSSSSSPISTINNYTSSEMKERSYTAEEASAINTTIKNAKYTIDGKDYTGTSTLGDFQANGWLVKSDTVVPETLGPGESYECKLIKGTYIIDSFRIMNDSKITIKTTDMPLYDLRIDDSALTVTAPYGFQIGMSESDMLALMSKNNLPYEKDAYTYSTYYNVNVYGHDAQEHYESSSLDISVSEGKVSSIRVDYYGNSGNWYISL